MPTSGSVVTEVGIRQAWLFLTLCDNEPTPPTEVRVYLDSNWTLGTTRFDLDADELESGLLTLCRVLNTTLAAASTSGADLVLDFEDHGRLHVDGRGAVNTTHDVWWLAKA
jgi:hypothetical protein